MSDNTQVSATKRIMVLFVLGLVMCGVYSLARGETAEADDGGYVPFEELTARARAELKHYAEQCVLIDGEIWSNETVSDRERQTRKLQRIVPPEMYKCTNARRYTAGFPDPYVESNAPIYYPLAGGQPHLNIESIQKATYRRALQNTPGAFAGVFTVTQVVDGGVLADDDFIVMDNAGLAENSRLEGVFRSVGTHTYTTVLGSSRTIDKLEPINLDIDTRAHPVTAEKLYDTLVRFNIRYFPIYRPRANIQSRPTFKSRGMGAGRGREYVAKAGNVDQKGEYEWEWEEIRQPLYMR